MNSSPSPKRKRKERSPSPKPTRIHVGRLTRNVNKDHIQEIFAHYGTIKEVHFPVDRMHQQQSRGFCYVEFTTPEEAENAMKHMDGGEIHFLNFKNVANLFSFLFRIFRSN